MFPQLPLPRFLLLLSVACFLVFLYAQNHYHLRDLAPAVRAHSGAPKHHRVGTGETEIPLGEKHKGRPKKQAIPKFFWNKSGPKGVSDQSKAWIQTCVDQNPDYGHKILDDAASVAYVREKFADRPDIVSVYTALTVPILQADLLRYLLLYADGGIWNDLDVQCIRPVADWIPAEYLNATNLVVGLEFDLPSDEDMASKTAINFSFLTFASWTIMAAPHSPHLMQVINDVLDDIIATSAAHNVPISGLTFEMIPDVVDMTGPHRLSRGIVKSLSRQETRVVSAKDFGKIEKPVLIGDVLVLPQIMFSSIQRYWPAEPPQELRHQVMVSHHYSGSWKKTGGEN